jgi:hypothetical protein
LADLWSEDFFVLHEKYMHLSGFAGGRELLVLETLK